MRATAILIVATAVSVASQAQPYFTDVFPPEEFAARRRAVLDEIGQAVAIVHGAPEMAAEVRFRQSNRFFYLTGVEVPRAILLLDGRSNSSTLFLPAPGRERYNGPDFGPGPVAASITGLDRVVPRESFADVLGAVRGDGVTLYTPHRPEVRGGGSTGEAIAHADQTAADPWDGRTSREAAFIAKLRALGPGVEVRDLDPVLDRLRFVKSEREIAVMRTVTRITGLGLMEAMREAAPGRYEYELSAAAEWVFRKHGAQGPAYFPLSAAGPNMVYSHYHRGIRRLVDGEMVQFDYAPDWHYYTSDVSRVFPANGRFTPRQREFYTLYLRLYQALMTSLGPGVPLADIARAAGAKMQAALDASAVRDPAIRKAAEAFIAPYTQPWTRRAFGHALGMEVHDVTAGRQPTLQPGELFTIEPPIAIDEERLAMRIEDVILITPDGFENLSAFVPIEPDDIERLMKEPGLSDLVAR